MALGRPNPDPKKDPQTGHICPTVRVCECATLCYAIVLPGGKSAIRAGFRPETNQASFKICPPAGLRPAGEDLILRRIRIRPTSDPETRFQHNDGSKRDHKIDI